MGKLLDSKSDRIMSFVLFYVAIGFLAYASYVDQNFKLFCATYAIVITIKVCSISICKRLEGIVR